MLSQLLDASAYQMSTRYSLFTSVFLSWFLRRIVSQHVQRIHRLCRNIAKIIGFAA